MQVNPKLERAELATLFFLQWMALAAWTVPLTLVLNAHGLQQIQPFAFATSAIGAFVSPLFFGAVADRHFAPTRVLRWLSVATAFALMMASIAIQRGWNAWIVLGFIQIHALTSSPTVSISTSIAMSRMADPRREFGPVRAVGTVGWMAGCVLVSLLNADASTISGFSSAAIWLLLGGFSFLLPTVEPPASAEKLTVKQRLGLDALTLLRNSDHRVVFLTTCLLNIPLAAFYPFTPLHLNQLGKEHPSAWMALAQSTEIVAMFALGALLTRWRVKWILLAGLATALARYGLAALNNQISLIAAIVLHGCTYTLVFVMAQIYVNERVEAAWRTRAQALLTLMNSGVGYLIGYLGCGWWFQACANSTGTDWTLFWGVLAGAVFSVMLYFLAAYHGRGVSPARNAPSPDLPISGT